MFLNPVLFPIAYAVSINIVMAIMYKLSATEILFHLLALLPLVVIVVDFRNLKFRISKRNFNFNIIRSFVKYYLLYQALMTAMLFYINGIPLFGDMYLLAAQIFNSASGRFYYIFVYKTNFVVCMVAAFIWSHSRRFIDLMFLFCIVIASIGTTFLMGSKAGLIWLVISVYFALWCSDRQIPPKIWLLLVGIFITLSIIFSYFFIKYRTDYSNLSDIISYLLVDRIFHKPAMQSGVLMDRDIHTYYFQPFVMEFDRILSKITDKTPYPYFNELVANVASNRSPNEILTGAVITINMIGYYSVGAASFMWTLLISAIGLFLTTIAKLIEDIHSVIFLFLIFRWSMTIITGSGNIILPTIGIFIEYLAFLIVYYVFMMCGQSLRISSKI